MLWFWLFSPFQLEFGEWHLWAGQRRCSHPACGPSPLHWQFSGGTCSTEVASFLVWVPWECFSCARSHACCSRNLCGSCTWVSRLLPQPSSPPQKLRRFSWYPLLTRVILAVWNCPHLEHTQIEMLANWVVPFMMLSRCLKVSPQSSRSIQILPAIWLVGFFGVGPACHRSAPCTQDLTGAESSHVWPRGGF